MLKIFDLSGFRRFQRFIKRKVLFLCIKGTVEIRGLPFVITGRAVNNIVIQRIPFYNGRRCVKEMQILRLDDALDCLAQRRGSQGTAGKNNDSFQILRFCNFFFHHRDQRMFPDKSCHCFGEQFPVHSQCASRRNLVSVRSLHDEGIQTAHLFFQKPYRVFHIAGPEGIAADQFRKIFGFMSRTGCSRPHFMQNYRNAPADNLPGCFTAGKSCTDHMYRQARKDRFCHRVLHFVVSRRHKQ